MSATGYPNVSCTETIDLVLSTQSKETLASLAECIQSLQSLQQALLTKKEDEAVEVIFNVHTQHKNGQGSKTGIRIFCNGGGEG